MNPFERDKHLIDKHEVDETVVDGLDADDARRLHRMMHDYRSIYGHEHADGVL